MKTVKIKHHLVDKQYRPGPEGLTGELGLHLPDLISNQMATPGFAEIILDKTGRFEIKPHELTSDGHLVPPDLSGFKRYSDVFLNNLRIFLPRRGCAPLYVVDRRSSSRGNKTLGYFIVQLILEEVPTAQEMRERDFMLWYVNRRDQQYRVMLPGQHSI